MKQVQFWQIILISIISISLQVIPVRADTLSCEYTISRMDILRGSRSFGYAIEIELGSYSGEASVIIDEGKSTHTQYDINIVNGFISREYEYPHNIDDLSEITFSLLIGSNSVIDKLVLNETLVSGSVGVSKDIITDIGVSVENSIDEIIISSNNIDKPSSVSLDKSGQSSQLVILFYIVIFVFISGSVLFIYKRK